MTHGGKREGAGRTAAQIDERRMGVLMGQGVSLRQIAERFNVPFGVIQYRARKLKKG